MVKRLAISAVLFLLFCVSLYGGGWGRGRWGFSGSGTASEARVEWADDMVADYEDRHGGYLGSTLRDELYDRLASGYLYNTFSPTKTECDFLLLWQFDDDLTGATWTNTGATLRWDIDGSVYVQNNLPSHTKTGAGILTVSSTDEFAGVTRIDFEDQPFTNSMIKWSDTFPNLEILILNNSGFHGVIDSLLGFTAIERLEVDGTGTIPLNITGELYKLNTLTTLTYLRGNKNLITGCSDSLHTLSDLTYLYWSRNLGLTWGNIDLIEHLSPNIYQFDMNGDSIWGDGTILAAYTDLKWLGISNELGGRTVVMDLNDVKSLVNMEFATMCGDSITGVIDSLYTWTKIENLNIGGTSYPRKNRGGNLSVIENFPNLTNLEIEHTNVTGDIAEFIHCPNVYGINAHHTEVYGDMIQLAGCDYINGYNLDSTHVTVSNRFITTPAYWIYFDSCGFTEAMCDTILNDVKQKILEEDYGTLVGTTTWDHAVTFRLRGNSPISEFAVACTTYIDSVFRAHGKNNGKNFYVDPP